MKKTTTIEYVVYINNIRIGSENSLDEAVSWANNHRDNCNICSKYTIEIEKVTIVETHKTVYTSEPKEVNL